MVFVGRIRYIIKVYLIYAWRKNINISIRGYIENDVVIKIDKYGSFKAKYFEVLKGTQIIVEKGASLELGDMVFFNRYCSINVKNKIKIGKGSLFGEGVKVYDHDHKYSEGLERNKFNIGIVDIGENCWLGSNVVVLRKSVIGNGAVIGAGVIVHGDIDKNMLSFSEQNLKKRGI